MDSGAESDGTLAAGAARGDDECFRLLVERYWTVMVGLALCKVKDTALAEDVAQEAFVQAHQRLASLRNPSSFAAFLARIVRNRSVDAVRRLQRERTVPLAELSERELATPARGNPGLTEEQRQTVWRAVERLPEKFKKVVLMRFSTGLSTPEIAVRLGQRPGTVRAWLHRACKRLRRDLAGLAEEVNEP